MCIGFPGQVTALDADGATVRTEGRTRRASTLVIPDIQVGDWVTVAAGTIVERLSADEAGWIEHRIRAAVARAAATELDDPHPIPSPPTNSRRP